MSVVKINGKPYKFTEHENELIKKNGLTPGMVAKRVRGGWALLEALNAPYGMRLAEYKEIVLSRIMQRESKEREIARQRRKEVELRKRKPHLFNVPQNIHVIRTGSMSLITKCSRNGVKHNEHNQ
ncbi:PVL ORF-50-like family [Staphylococcus aureus]|uniref:PVL ORF-50-like family n=8 Tax=Bacillales TaxID=1385 RepID=A0A380EHQ2_STAAU|nr:PVL ORF-50-like family [Staphylococcus aureus]